MLWIIATVALFAVLAVAACFKVSSRCSRAEEKQDNCKICKKCKHWDKNHCSEGHGWCRKIASYTAENWFCADQEREENEKH